MTSLARPAWTPNEEKRLRWDWGVFSVDNIAGRLGRSPTAVYLRAKKLELGLGCPPGWVTLNEAAKRLGFGKQQVRQILRDGGATIKRAWSRPGEGAQRAQVVEWDSARAAAEKWLATEPVYRVAGRLGVSHPTLRELLVRAVVFSPFMGIGSEGYVAIQEKRRFAGAELKDSYFRQAVANLKAASVTAQMTLFDVA